MFVTSLYAGLLALFFVVLSMRVVFMRRSGRINLGDGGNAEMTRRVRAHGNFAEYVPLALILMGLLEVRGGSVSPLVLHALGLMLLIGRLLHGIALGWTEQWFPGRAGGAVLTFLVLLIAGVLNAWHGIAGLLLQATATGPVT